MSGWNGRRVVDSSARISTRYRNRTGECRLQTAKSRAIHLVPALSPVVPVSLVNLPDCPNNFPMTWQTWLHLAHRTALVLALTNVGFYAHSQVQSEADWPNYGNDPGGMRHSALSQINRENVARLKVAWIYHTGDISADHDGRRRSGFETTPILIDGKLYLTTPFNRVIALDPATGR
jgi:hypothetical protein